MNQLEHTRVHPDLQNGREEAGNYQLSLKDRVWDLVLLGN